MRKNRHRPRTHRHGGVTPEIKQSRDRRRPPIDVENAKDIVAVVRYPGDTPFDSLDRRLFAYDRASETDADNRLFPEETYKFHSDQLQRVSQPHIDFVKLGPCLVDTLGFDWDPGLAAFLLQLRLPDEDLSRAFFAALFTATNTSNVRPDWGAIVLALATFVHALPAYARIANGGEFQQPFGRNTGWTVATPYPTD